VTPYYDDGSHVIYHGDTLEVLAALSGVGLEVDAVVTDPPYASGTRTESGKPSSGAMMRGQRWAAKPIDLDQMTTTGFVWLMRQIGLATYSMLPDGGSLLSFIDWRQWPQLVAAIETCNYRIQGMVVWDKGSPALGNGFRSQHELVMHASKGVPVVHDRSTGNVIASKRQRADDHPSPKPVGLMARLIQVVSPVGGIVLDPFMGSGATLRAAADSGRRSIGIDSVESYCEVAAKRLTQGSLWS
jgi:site-specific DNA-methyltransferase (adenine-specific)